MVEKKQPKLFKRLALIIALVLLVPTAIGATYYGITVNAYEKQIIDLNEKSKKIDSLLKKDVTAISDDDFKQLNNLIESYQREIDIFQQAKGTIVTYGKDVWHQNEVEKHRRQYKDFINRQQALISLRNRPAKSEASGAVVYKRGETYGKLRIPSIDLEVALSEGLSPDKNDTAKDSSLLEQMVAHVNVTKHPGQKSQIYLAGHNNMQFNALGKIQDKAEIFIDMPYGTFKYIVHAAPAKNNPEQKVGMVVHESRGDAIQPDLGYEELVLQTCYPLNQYNATPYRFLLYAYPEGETPKISLPGYEENR